MDAALIVMFIVYGTLLFGCLSIGIGVSWTVHLSQNKDQHKPYGWGTYKQFMREFEKYGKWTIDNVNENSFFGEIVSPEYRTRDSKYYIHAGIIQFDNRCMNLYPLSYFRVRCFLKKEWKKRYWVNRTKIKW